jgi:serine/threonine protein kinase
MDEIFDRIKSGEFEVDRDLISEDAEDLIRHMIVVNPEKRFTAMEVLEHPWIKQSEAKFRRKGTMFKELDNEH